MKWPFLTPKKFRQQLAALHGQAQAQRLLLKTTENIQELRKKAEQLAQDIEVLSAEYPDPEGRFRLVGRHWGAGLIAASMLELLQSYDAKNYIQLEFDPQSHVDSNGKWQPGETILLTIQRWNGEMPAVKVARLEKELEILKRSLGEKDDR